MAEEKHIVEQILEYATEMGFSSIGKTEGLWEHDVDDKWTITCNPHKEKIESVPPLCFAIEFNGWPAGILSVWGEGIICAGEAGNAESLSRALSQRLEKEGINV